MAGLDRMYDARGFIQQYIEHQIRELLEDPMNEYQDPNWVQAALLFDQVVTPIEGYTLEELYALANDIVKVAEKNNNRVIYQRIPGIYNEKIIDVNSTDMNRNSQSEYRRIIEYDVNIEKIKKWMRDKNKIASEIENL